MPQKQKQTQRTSVVVNIGAKSKSKSKRKPRRSAAPSVARQMITIVSQGGSMPPPSLASPPPQTQQYNELVKGLNELRTSQLQSNSLIQRIGRNDLLNTITATNPLQVVSTNTQANMIDPYEGLVENVVEDNLNIDPFVDDNFTVKVPMDQNFVENINVAEIAPSLTGVRQQLNFYDDPNLEDRLADNVISNRRVHPAKYQREAFQMTGEDILSRQMNELYTQQEDEAQERYNMSIEDAYSFRDRNLGERMSNKIAPSLGGSITKLNFFDDEDLEEKLIERVRKAQLLDNYYREQMMLKMYGDENSETPTVDIRKKPKKSKFVGQTQLEEYYSRQEKIPPIKPTMNEIIASGTKIKFKRKKSSK